METILSRTPIATRSLAERYRDEDCTTAMNAQYSGSTTIKIPGNAIHDVTRDDQAICTTSG